MNEGTKEELISQGAEGRVYRTQFQSKDAIVKERFSKKYRHPELDAKITRSRLNSEGRNIEKCRQLGLDSPAVFLVDKHNSRLYMEYIEGCTVKEHLRLVDTNSAEALDLALRIGKAIATLHDGNIIHGDLTTSNIMLRERDVQKIVMIDFGLSYISTSLEDRAVDLYVMERAFLSTHPNSEELFSSLLTGYVQQSKNGKGVSDRLNQVRARGRKKSMLG
ncbi:bud32 [Acrasis kona]|uniref:non-specific serine/threonine protein kinase n=1 Tax=Acrasis kona TaxID=1008807 RepID=A0AAW2YUM8_9EUKA